MLRLYRIRFWVLGALFLLTLGALAGISRLELRFSLLSFFEPGHPARESFQEFRQVFPENRGLTLYFHGPQAFSPGFLSDLEGFQSRLREQGLSSFSVLDLFEPRVREGKIWTQSVLPRALTQEPEALAQRLGSDPFDGPWVGILHSRDLQTLGVWVFGLEDSEDPRVLSGALAGVEALARDLAQSHQLAVYPFGPEFLRVQMRQVAAEDQRLLLAFGFGFEVLVFWILFQSLALSLLAAGLLSWAALLGFGSMGWAGIPLSFLSLNLGLFVFVLGTADLIHLFTRAAHHQRRLGASTPQARLRASHKALGECLRPLTATSVTTAACLLLPALTPFAQLKDFSLSLALGVFWAWALSVTLAPLALSGLRLDGTRSRGAWLEARVAALSPKGSRPRTGIHLTFLALALGAAGAARQVPIQSDWLEAFAPGTPVARTRDFLAQQGLPRGFVSLTYPIPKDFSEVESEALEEDFEVLTQLLQGIPGVLRVESALGSRRTLRARVQALEFPPELDPIWAQARRDSYLRRAEGIGLFLSGENLPARLWRVGVALEESGTRGLSRFEDRFRQALESQRFQRLRKESWKLEGAGVYHRALIEEIPRSFFRISLASVALLTGFLWIWTRSLGVALRALGPNLFPLLGALGVAGAVSIPIDEGLVFLVALSFGVAVDDSLHLLEHYLNPPERPHSWRRAFREAGAPAAVTSLLLVGGFGLTAFSRLLPLRRLGGLLALSVTLALLADIFWLPALLPEDPDR